MKCGGLARGGDRVHQRRFHGQLSRVNATVSQIIIAATLMDVTSETDKITVTSYFSLIVKV